MTDPRWHTAIHEAGHAVAARAMGYAVRRISIVPDEDAHGHCFSYPFAKSFDPDLADYDPRVRRRLEAQVIIMCAGAIAETRVNSDDLAVSLGSRDDHNNAHDLATWASAGNADEGAAYLGWLKCRAETIVFNAMWWAAIEGLARALLDQPTMTGKEAQAAIQAALDAELAAFNSGRQPNGLSTD